MGISLDTDVSTLDPEQVVYKVLGGSVGPYPIKIDQILVTSTWRPNICIADEYISPKGRSSYRAMLHIKTFPLVDTE